MRRAICSLGLMLWVVPLWAATEVEERVVTWDDLPLAVQETVRLEAGDHVVTELEEATIDGNLVYEAEWRDGDLEIDITVSPEGRVLSRESELFDEDEDEDDGGR